MKSKVNVLRCLRAIVVRANTSFHRRENVSMYMFSYFCLGLLLFSPKKENENENMKIPEQTLMNPQDHTNFLPKRFLSWGLKTLFASAGGG